MFQRIPGKRAAGQKYKRRIRKAENAGVLEKSCTDINQKMWI